jgi:superfamily I DNA/RNA helicase
VVLIPGIGFMPMQSKPPEEEARLLYVGMTRAINQLVMTCDRSSSFVRRLERALGRVA